MGSMRKDETAGTSTPGKSRILNNPCLIAFVPVPPRRHPTTYPRDLLALSGEAGVRVPSGRCGRDEVPGNTRELIVTTTGRHERARPSGARYADSPSFGVEQLHEQRRRLYWPTNRSANVGLNTCK